MKIKSLMMFLALIPVILSAKTLTKNELKTLGTRAFQQKAQHIRPEAAQYTLKSCDFLEQDGLLDVAILHFDAGFLIMSAEDAVLPVLAYDFENSIDVNDLAPGAQFFLDYYRQQIAAARRIQLSQSEKVRNAWEEIRHPSERGSRAVAVVAPLLYSTWNQNKYYNYLCPEDEEAPGGYDGRVPNGCVAVAMSQIMYYYRYPENGNGHHTNHSDYGNFYVNFAQQHYNYDAMCDAVSYYNNEVAKLIFHAGTAVDMAYGSDGSGAYSEFVPDAMSDYFRYSPDSYRSGKYHYSDEEWHNKLKIDLDANRPIYYSGYSEEGGHAFVCDGYNTDDYFHFNFGWGGSGNGYYVTENNDSVQNAVNGYDYGQSAIFNLHPLESNYPTYCRDKVLLAINGSLEDGSGHLPYLNNANCTYIITHPSQYSVNIDLQNIDTQEDHDYLRFWDGHPSQNMLLWEHSGTGSFSNLSFETDSLYITFESDDSVTGQGWRLTYNSFREGFGCGTNVYTTPTGEISDNSTDEFYRDNSNCLWNIRLSSGHIITFTFEEMDISPEDHLIFYDLASYPNEVIADISGNVLPEPLTCYTNKVRIHFFSDNYLNGTGFLAHWNASGVGIDDKDFPATLYPNPASDLIHLTLSEEFDHCVVTINNMVGNTVFSQVLSTEKSLDIPVHQLANGVYILSADCDGRAIHKKIVIQH